jgi:hypothetical protein
MWERHLAAIEGIPHRLHRLILIVIPEKAQRISGIHFDAGAASGRDFERRYRYIHLRHAVYTSL